MPAQPRKPQRARDTGRATPGRPAAPRQSGGTSRTPRPAADAPRGGRPAGDTPRNPRPTGDTPRGGRPASGSPRAPRSDAPRAGRPASGSPRTDAPRTGRPAADSPRTPRADSPRAPRAEAPRTPRPDSPRSPRPESASRPRRPAGDASRTGRPARPASAAARPDRAPRAGARPDRADRPVRAERAPVGPPLPPGADPRLLPGDARRELRGLPDPVADRVAGHLVAAGQLLDEDPAAAYEHAKAAKALAARVGAVREAAGVAAYRAGDYAAALTDLKAARRITGLPDHLPLLADCERALGRPDRALAYAADPDRERLDHASRIELAIVVSGARRDLGQPDAAVLALQGPDLDSDAVEDWTVRLWYAYADALLAAGRRDDAIEWLTAVATVDEDGDTDAAERLAALSPGATAHLSPEAAADPTVDPGAAPGADPSPDVTPPAGE